MLNLFNSFVVPGVDYVTIYHDDQDDHLFYMLPEFPTLTRMPDSGPVFSLLVFARDFSLMKDAGSQLAGTETEGGLLRMQTELSVSDTDQAKIISYIQNQLPGAAYRPWFVGPLSMRFMRIEPFTSPIKLSYPTWVSGKVSFCLIPTAAGPSNTFIKAEEGSDQPSLIATNIANYSALLGQEGEELIRDAVTGGHTPGSVNYSVSFIARIPSLTVTVTGNMSDVYSEVKAHCIPMLYRSRMYYCYNSGVSDLQTFRNTYAKLNITVDSGDWQSSTTSPSMAQDVEKKLNDMVFQIVEDYIKTKFFGSTFSPGAQSDSGGSSGDGSSTPGSGQNWLLGLSGESLTGTLDFEVTYRSNITVTKNPNRLLFEILTADEVKQRITEADLNSPEFQELDVPVRVTADFANDPIAAIKVVLNYNQTDDATGEPRVAAQTFVFQTGQEVQRFQAVMAKDAKGVPKDNYTYHSEISYKASSQTEKTAVVTTNDRALIIGYNQLSCVRVQVTLGSVPADIVQRVQIHFRYPGLDLPTAEKDVFLSAEHATDSWFTYTGGNTSVEYEYTVSYFLTSGERIDTPLKRDRSNTQVINSPFVDMLKPTFVSGGSFPPATSIVVSTRYSDASARYNIGAVHPFTSAGSTWTWNVYVLDKDKRGFEYKVDVTYADGSAEQGDWNPGVEGTIIVGPAPRQILEVDVVPSLVDTAKVWKLVVVRLSYQDPPNQISLDQIFQFTSANSAQTASWKVPIKDASARKYTYEIDAFGFDTKMNKTVGPTTTNDRLLVIQL